MTRTPPPPPRAGDDADRDALAGCWRRAAFREAELKRRLGIDSLDGLETTAPAELSSRLEACDELALLTRLFVLGEAVERDEFDRLITRVEAAACDAAGLTLPAGEGRHVFSPFRLVPLETGDRDVVVACDRTDAPAGVDATGMFPDFVFSGHNSLTRQFVRMIPTTPTGSVLDLCSGTGVGALAAASSARRVVAADLTDRSTAFARFNTWINRTDVDVRQGDLFEPIAGERFDRIFSHPPYVPTLFETAVYRDGGETGDRLVRRIVSEVPDHLEDGGTFHILTIGMDVRDAAFEQRAREWLGPASREFDLVFALATTNSPIEFARSLVAKVKGSGAEDYDRWISLFSGLEVSKIVYGGLVGRRRAGLTAQPETRRVMAQDGAGPEGFHWLFDWFDWLRRPNRLERVMAATPVLASTAMLDVHHVVEEARFVPRTFKLQNDGTPFQVKLEIEGWIASVLSAFDGQQPVSAVCAETRQRGMISPEFDDEAFVDLVCFLAERGFLKNLADFSRD